MNARQVVLRGDSTNGVTRRILIKYPGPIRLTHGASNNPVEVGSRGKLQVKLINRISLSIALICIAIGTAVSILGIWGFIGDTGIIWRALATLGVVFLASLMVVAVNNMLSSRGGGE